MVCVYADPRITCCEPLIILSNIVCRCKNSLMFFFQTGKSKIPLYNTLNIQLKGYDFPVLESYQGFVHHIAEVMGIEVADGYVIYIHMYLDLVFFFMPPLSDGLDQSQWTFFLRAHAQMVYQFQRNPFLCPLEF